MRRLAAQGFSVLVVCFNRFLAEHLRRGLEDVEGIDAYSYDGLALSVVREANPTFPAEPPNGDQGSYWNDLRRAFSDSVLDVAAGRYGALIVDEAQDFQPDWWTPLQLMLDDPDESPLYVFFDDNQRIFAVPENLPVPGEPMQLTVNCRNTKTINRLVNSFYRGATIEADGPEGIPIDKHFYATDGELLEQLDSSVERWLNEAEVNPEDIALLTPKAAHRSALWKVDKVGGVRLTDDPWESGPDPPELHPQVQGARAVGRGSRRARRRARRRLLRRLLAPERLPVNLLSRECAEPTAARAPVLAGA